MNRLIDRKSVERLIGMLKSDYLQAMDVQRKLGGIEWKKLPERAGKCRVYAVDGSQGKKRLSGVVLYIVSSVAFGNGPRYGMSYVNTMRYNHGLSDQVVRLQMETLENKVGYIAGELEGMDIIMMDGTLTGSLTRPPVYPENTRGIRTIESALSPSELENLVEEFVGRLEEHYSRLMSQMRREKRLREGTVLADAALNEFSKFYEDMEGHTVPDDNGGERRLTLDEARNSVHVVLGYLEYLYSLERLLEMDVVYVAKSFYNRKVTQRFGVEMVDVPFLDAYLRTVYGEEIPGYMVVTQGGAPISHKMPKVLRDRFPLVEDRIESGVPMVYLRTMKGGIIYLVQSNRSIDEGLLGRMLVHEKGGYFRPLQRAHESVKIDNRTFESEVAALLNIIKKEAPELLVFFKYGRTPLE